VSDFKLANDVAAMFVQEQCDLGAEKRVGPTPLYTAYKNYCESGGYKPKARNTVAADWERLGFKKWKTNGEFFYHGLGLKSVISSVPEVRPFTDGEFTDLLNHHVGVPSLN
jgi:Poxvirus D5 protein-like